MRTQKLILFLLAGGVALAPLLPAAPLEEDHQAVLSAVQHVFDAMAAHDGAALSSLLMPEASVIAARSGAQGTSGKTARTTGAEFAERIGASKDALLERIWDAKVSIDGPIAHVWAPYEFHHNGVFSHCGIDSISLVKSVDGWKIASIVYTAKTTGCPVPPPEKQK